MSDHPHCPSPAALRDLISRANITVVSASLLASGVSQAIVDAIQHIASDILLVTATPSSIASMTTISVQFEDVVVFTREGMIAHVPRRAELPQTEAFASLLLMLIDQNAASKKFADQQESFLRLVVSAVDTAASWVSDEDQSNTKPRIRDPNTVLGVAPGASRTEIKKARDRLLEIAHSDRLNGLHPALVALANDLTRDILDAYKALVKQAAE